MSKYPTNVYQFPNANASEIYNYLNNLYNNGTPDLNGPGRAIGTYMLYFNDCTTIVTHALQLGGVNIPTINSPYQFRNYMDNPMGLPPAF